MGDNWPFLRQFLTHSSTFAVFHSPFFTFHNPSWPKINFTSLFFCQTYLQILLLFQFSPLKMVHLHNHENFSSPQGPLFLNTDYSYCRGRILRLFPRLRLLPYCTASSSSFAATHTHTLWAKLSLLWQIGTMGIFLGLLGRFCFLEMSPRDIDAVHLCTIQHCIMGDFSIKLPIHAQ